MKIILIIIALTAMFCTGCQNPGVVQLSPNVYLLTREDHGGIFGSASALKAGVISDANVFAKKQGKVAIPLSSKSHPVGVLGDWASFEYQFRLVDTNSPEALSSSAIEMTEQLIPGNGTWPRPERYTETQYKVLVSTNQP